MSKLYLTLLFIFSTNLAIADTCPISPLKIEPALKSTVEFDQKSGLYTYSYIMENRKSAPLPIYFFYIMFDEAPTDIKTPIGTDFDFRKKDVDTSTPSHLQLGLDSAQEERFKYLEPGAKSGIYSFKSKQAPGLVRYYVRGKTGIPKSAIPGSDEPPECPGFAFEGAFDEDMVNGITTGPAPLNQISVEFKLKKMKKDRKDNGEEGNEDFVETTPHKDTGKIVAVLKSKKDFDVTTINISSIRLGMGRAPVETSEVKGPKNHEELRLIFDVSKLGIECDRDRVLFLTGKTTDGKDILGAEPIKTKECDVPKPTKIKSKAP